MLMTFETPDLFRVERISDSAVSHLSDNVVLLNYVNDHDSIQRAMSVIKSRAGHHQPRIRKFLIGRDGIVLADSHPSEGVSDTDRPSLPGSQRRTGN